jgi:hypothetical protein
MVEFIDENGGGPGVRLRFRDNQEKWNGAARDLQRVKFV